MDTLGKQFHVNFLGFAYSFMSINISQLKYYYTSVYQARCYTSGVAKYQYTATFNKSTIFYKITLTSDMIFTKDDASTSDDKFEKLTREFNIHYRACIGSLIYLLSTRVDLSFVVRKLAKFSSNLGKLYFEGFIQFLRKIGYNKTMGLKYYAEIRDATLSDMLRQASIKTDNQLMTFSGSIWKDFPDNGRITGGYIILYQGGPVDHGTHFPGLVDQSSAESEYNEACTAGMALAHFRMLIHELLNKD